MSVFPGWDAGTVSGAQVGGTGTQATPVLSAHGLSIRVPGGWDVRIFAAPPATSYPIAHAANFALPARRDSFGGTVVATMSRSQVFVALLDFGPNTAPGTGLFAPVGLPRTLDPAWFDPYQMQRAYPGMAGMQRFFTEQGHKFCLYAAIGSSAQRQPLVAQISAYLAGIVIQASGRSSTGSP